MKRRGLSGLWWGGVWALALVSSCGSGEGAQLFETVDEPDASVEDANDSDSPRDSNGGGKDARTDSGDQPDADAGDDGNAEDVAPDGGAAIDAEVELDAGEDADLDPTTPPDGDAEADASPTVCGDFRCEEKKGETCEECPIDCGECPKCDLAPNCTGAFSVPIEFTALPEFNNNGSANYGSGVGMGVSPEETTCSAPRLKIQLSQIKVHKTGLGFPASGGYKVFCVVEANDGKDMELVLTQLEDIDGNKSVEVTTSQGIFWGHGMSTVKESQFNLTISYGCYRDKSGDAWADIFNGISDAAGAGAGIPGNPYGWAFDLGSIAAGAAQAAIQKAGVTPILSVEQRIDKEALLMLTHGKTWKIRQKDKFKDGWFNDGSDIELTVRAWGCSTPRPLPPH